MSISDFDWALQRYLLVFGATFTTLGIPGVVKEIALLQMLECLNGDREDPVTNESIGYFEGVIESDRP